MTDDIPRAGEFPAKTGPMPMCPMGETCKRMMARPPSGILAFVPGALLIIAGILIVVEPGLLVWLIAVTSILIGLAMLGCAYFMRRVGARLMRAHR